MIIAEQLAGAVQPYSELLVNPGPNHSPSILELLHPDGTVHFSLVLGSNCPASLCVSVQAVSKQSLDLIVLAPTRHECGTEGWLESNIQLYVPQLAADGLIYVLAPPRWRRHITKLLQPYHLVTERWLVHFPNLRESRYLVPLAVNPVRYAFSNLVETRRWKSIALLFGVRSRRMQSFVTTVLPQTAFVARRPRSRRLFDWLFRDRGCEEANVILGSSWRGNNGSTVLFRFCGGEADPSGVAKLGQPEAAGHDTAREVGALERLGEHAMDAGAVTPRTLMIAQIGARRLLVETTVRGKPAAILIGKNPTRWLEIMEHICEWLERWNRSTRTLQSWDDAQLNRAVLEPAALLAPYLTHGIAYAGWLKTRVASLQGTPIPMVAAHNDLTMSNILLSEDGRLGVIDWETAQPTALPLIDFFYSVVDAVAATHRFENRVTAFDSCFSTEGANAKETVRLQEKQTQALGISSSLVEICFHACWLHHAVNEHKITRSNDPRPFLQIVQRLVQRRSQTETEPQ